VADSLRDASFYAGTRSEEAALPGMYAEQVVGVETVTAAVEAARSATEGGRAQAIEAVERKRQAEAEPDRRVEVVREAGGTRYVAYTYRRYDDVRLAFVADRAVRGSGRLGTPLSYPQHAWDVAVLRLYEDDRPLQTPQHLEVRAQGPRPGDAVFAVAHPPTTRRAETHEQLAFRRDVSLPARRAVLAAGTDRLHRYVDTARSVEAPWRDRLAEAEEAHRRVRAQLEALRNAYVMARLQSRDRQLRRAAGNDSSAPSERGEEMDRLASIQEEKRALAPDYRTFAFLMHPAHSSATLRRALLAYRGQRGDTAAAGTVEERLEAISAQPAALDAAALADHLQHLHRHVADSTVRRALPPPASAPSIVQGSIFSDPQQARARVQQGALPDDDPALSLVATLYDPFARFREAWTALRAEERRLTDSLARRRHQAAGQPVTLPRNRALRIADGRVQGYPYNGTVAPPFTTFYGLYERHHALRATGNAGELPRPWRTPAGTLERATPLTTVASTDLGGGAYGGPLLNTSLQVVGIVADGNVQSAAGQYLFLPGRMRAVAVDLRGVLEGLSAVYEADRLVREMRGNPASP
jgi:hypothetical protein